MEEKKDLTIKHIFTHPGNVGKNIRKVGKSLLSKKIIFRSGG
jgi:hypothetical protein